MRKLLLAFAFLPQFAVAQSQADSLWTVYRNPKATPVQRLHALRGLFDSNLISQRPDTFAKYVSAMHALAEQVGDRDLLASAVMNRGVQFSLQADQDRADSCFARADALLGPIGSPYVRAQLLTNQGVTLGNRGLTGPAMDKYTQALVLADSLRDARLIRPLKNNMANLYAQSGDIAKAAEMFTSALRMAEQVQDSASIGNLLSNIGACHNIMGDQAEARPYFRRAAAIFERIGSANLPRPYLNLASTFRNSDPDSAMYYCRRTIDAAERTGDASMLMGGYQLMSDLLSGPLNQPDSAMACLHKAMVVAQGVRNLGFEMTIKGSLARLEFDRGNTSKAIALTEEMLAGAREMGNVELQKNAAEGLVQFYRRAGRHDKALEMLELKVALTDSIDRVQNQREMIRQEYKYGYEKQALADSLSFAAETAIQQKEVQKQKLMRNGFMGGFALVALFAGVFFVQRNRISKARKRSDELLLNILPEEVAEELKDTGAALAKHFDNATILFTDFKGFTQLSEQVTPAELVAELNTCFKAFDAIMGKYRIEKIKTIGDAYMAAGGLPDPKHGSPADVVRAALEMQDFMKAYKTERDAWGLPAFEMRIGIHTGPVVAGIVGVKKFQYDIWGDSVNTASRMESSGEVGQVNISEATYVLVKDVRKKGSEEAAFHFTPRGKVQAKGKGEREMYFVERG